MKNIVILILFVVLILAVSCDTKFYADGLIVDKTTKFPLEQVMISVKTLDTIYTDSYGKFHIDTFIHRYAGDFEILLTKEGYKTTHINFSKIQRTKKEYLFEMEKLQNYEAPCCLNRQRVRQMYYFNKFFLSAFNVLTIVFILFRRKLKWRFFWIAGILILNPTFFVSVADCSLMSLKILNGPIYLTHFSFYPFSVMIVLPVFPLLFWFCPDGVRLNIRRSKQ